MKKIVILTVALFSLTSCNLDVARDSNVVYEGYWSSEEAVNAARTGVYTQFRSQAMTLWRMGEVRSDVWGGKTIETANDDFLTANDISTTKVPFTNWAGFYSNILYCNDYIINEPKVAGAGSADRNRMLAEIYGIRAYFYLMLLKTWGDVPITLDPIVGVPDPNAINKKREPKAAVMAQIKSDIQKSLELFGTNNSLYSGKSVYWSRPATLTLKGEAYLWFANVLNSGQADLIEAKNALSQVTGFALVPNFSDIWGVANENKSEYIFSLDYQENQATNPLNDVLTGRKQDVAIMFNKEGIKQTDLLVSGGNRYGLNPKVITMFDNDPQDLRAKSTYMMLYADNNGGAGYPTFEPTKYKASIWLKFLGDVVNGSRVSYTNMPVYRYADVLLMLAEAKNKLGEDPSAEINLVRQRAYGANYPSHVYVNADQDTNTKAILNERLKEFLGEGKRWYDLMRAGGNYIFQEVSTLNNAPISGNPKKLYLPISQQMIDNDPNNMTQTDGY